MIFNIKLVSIVMQHHLYVMPFLYSSIYTYHTHISIYSWLCLKYLPRIENDQWVHITWVIIKFIWILFKVFNMFYIIYNFQNKNQWPTTQGGKATEVGIRLKSTQSRLSQCMEDYNMCQRLWKPRTGITWQSRAPRYVGLTVHSSRFCGSRKTKLIWG